MTYIYALHKINKFCELNYRFRMASLGKNMNNYCELSEYTSSE